MVRDAESDSKSKSLEPKLFTETSDVRSEANIPRLLRTSWMPDSQPRPEPVDTPGAGISSQNCYNEQTLGAWEIAAAHSSNTKWVFFFPQPGGPVHMAALLASRRSIVGINLADG